MTNLKKMAFILHNLQFINNGFVPICILHFHFMLRFLLMYHILAKSAYFGTGMTHNCKFHENFFKMQNISEKIDSCA